MAYCRIVLLGLTVATTIASASMSSPRSFPGLAFEDHNSSKEGLSTGAKAGIGVGVSIGSILILLTLGFLIARRRKRRRNGQHASQDTSSLDEENSDRAREKVELPVTGRHLAHQLPELSSNGPQSLYVSTRSPTESVAGRVELPAAESDGSATAVSAISAYTDRSPRSPGAGSTVRYSQAELEGHQVPELAPSPLFSKEIGR